MITLSEAKVAIVGLGYVGLPLAVEFGKKQLGGSLKGKKIAYIYFDNPAGKEPLGVAL